MEWYSIFPKEKPKDNYSPTCLYDGKATESIIIGIATCLSMEHKIPMQIFKGKLWRTVYVN